MSVTAEISTANQATSSLVATVLISMPRNMTRGFSCKWTFTSSCLIDSKQNFCGRDFCTKSGSATTTGWSSEKSMYFVVDADIDSVSHVWSFRLCAARSRMAWPKKFTCLGCEMVWGSPVSLQRAQTTSLWFQNRAMSAAVCPDELISSLLAL